MKLIQKIVDKGMQGWVHEYDDREKREKNIFLLFSFLIFFVVLL